MSPQSIAAISAAQAQNAGVFVSPITAWEIATLVARSRIQLSMSPEAWFNALLALPGVRLAANQRLEFSPNISLRGRRHLWVEWDDVS